MYFVGAMKTTLTLFFLGFFTLLAQAQQGKPAAATLIKNEIGRSTLDTNEIVFDESGKALRYYQYQKLLNSGNYTISRNLNDPGAQKIVKKISADEKERMYGLIKNLMVIKSPLLQENMKLDLKPFENFFPEEQLRNKVILMVFWNVDCPPCTESFSDLDDMAKELDSPKDLLILAITSNAKKVVSAKLKEKPLIHGQVISDARKMITGYELNSFPSYVVADKNGIIRFSISGMSQITIPGIKKAIVASLAK